MKKLLHLGLAAAIGGVAGLAIHRYLGWSSVWQIIFVPISALLATIMCDPVGFARVVYKTFQNDDLQKIFAVIVGIIIIGCGMFIYAAFIWKTIQVYRDEPYPYIYGSGPALALFFAWIIATVSFSFNFLIRYGSSWDSIKAGLGKSIMVSPPGVLVIIAVHLFSILKFPVFCIANILLFSISCPRKLQAGGGAAIGYLLGYNLSTSLITAGLIGAAAVIAVNQVLRWKRLFDPITKASQWSFVTS